MLTLTTARTFTLKLYIYTTSIMMSDKVNNKNFFSEIITENYIDREIYFQKEYWRGWVKH